MEKIFQIFKLLALVTTLNFGLGVSRAAVPVGQNMVTAGQNCMPNTPPLSAGLVFNRFGILNNVADSSDQ
jgi:hypothetical protein